MQRVEQPSRPWQDVAIDILGPPLAKWLLEFLGIPRIKGVNFHGKFGLGIPRNS